MEGERGDDRIEKRKGEERRIERSRKKMDER